MDTNMIYDLFSRYNMTSEKIQNITPQQIEETYEFLHQNYMSYFEELENKPINMNDYFSWTSKKMDIHLLYVMRDGKIRNISFLSKSEKKGTIIIHDLSQEKIGYETLSLMGSEDLDFLSALIYKKMINIEPEKIIPYTVYGDIGVLGERFFSWEYDHNWKPQLETPFENISFNTLRIHKDIYDFGEMIKTINNDQFTLELEECLEVYESEKFFVCAAGLGSVLEHLLYLSITKQVLDEKDIHINENSTASEYIGQLKKEPFNINKREVSHLKLIFNYRNSVSHFNKGFFSKEMCDHLLGGIKLAFDNYYMFKNRSKDVLVDEKTVELVEK